MATPLIAGGSANITLDLTKSQNWELTGLDNNGQVLENVNVKVSTLGSTATSIQIILPTIESLNYRNVVFNIDTNDYGQNIVLVANGSNTINGEGSLTIAYVELAVAQISVSSSTNWTLPLLQEAP